MATKPTANKPDWVLSTPSAREEPSAGKKVLGWIFNEPYPEKNANWLWYSVSVWMNYFELAIDELAGTGYLDLGVQGINTGGDIAGLEGVLLLLDSSGGPFTLNLPDPALNAGNKWFFKDLGNSLSSNPVTLNRFGAHEIEGASANYLLETNLGSWVLYCDGVDYFFVTESMPDLSVTTEKLAPLAVTTAKIADDSVTPAKLSVPYQVYGYALPVANDTGKTSDFSGATFGTAKAIAFNDDGTKLYMVSEGGTGATVFQFSCSTAYDIATATYDSVSFSVNAQENAPESILFNAAGTKMYITGESSDRVHQYSLSAAFDLSTATYDSVSLDVSPQTANPQGMAFNSAGTKLFVAGGTFVYQYTLATPYDLSTASYDSVSYDATATAGAIRAVTFSADGTRMFLIGAGNFTVFEYVLLNPFLLNSGVSYANNTFVYRKTVSGVEDLVFNPDGSFMYILGLNSSGRLTQYNTGVLMVQP